MRAVATSRLIPGRPRILAPMFGLETWRQLSAAPGITSFDEVLSTGEAPLRVDFADYW